MAKAKKIQKYVPTTKLPSNGREWKILDASGKYDDYFAVIAKYDSLVRPGLDSWQAAYYDPHTEKFKTGEWNVADWKTVMGEYRHHALLQAIWPYTEEYTALNDTLMKEYDSRDDLQEIYKEAAKNNYYYYDTQGRHYNQREAQQRGWESRPNNYQMFRDVMNRSTDAMKKIELARETPYLEGDLVLLRTPYVGHRDVDPLWVNPYSEEARAGAGTPDASTPRIATVIGVTERVGNWRGTKGSKVIQLVWMGQEDMLDVEEKYIKWHERPTYKNGMKKRPENRE